MNYDHKDLFYFRGAPGATAVIKQQPEDFIVEEELGFEPDGGGEHHFLWVEKRLANTAEVADRIAGQLGLPRRAVTWSGQKDRQAVTRQWFGVHWPGVPELDNLPGDEVFKVLRAERNSRKLRIGSHRKNRFQLRLRQCRGDRQQIEDRLASVAREGVPNYFGLQRFGRDGANLQRGSQWLLGQRRLSRGQQSMALSAIRSALFNQMLSDLIAAGRWQAIEAGDTVMLSGSNSVFTPIEEELPSTRRRVEEGDCSATLPLCGGDAEERVCNDFEREWLAGYGDYLAAMKGRRIKSSRRAQALWPEALNWQWLDSETLELTFLLPKGAFATSLLRELVVFED